MTCKSCGKQSWDTYSGYCSECQESGRVSDSAITYAERLRSWQEYLAHEEEQRRQDEHGLTDPDWE